jgi:hypothetical protein
LYGHEPSFVEGNWHVEVPQRVDLLVRTAKSCVLLPGCGYLGALSHLHLPIVLAHPALLTPVKEERMEMML